MVTFSSSLTSQGITFLNYKGVSEGYVKHSTQHAWEFLTCSDNSKQLWNSSITAWQKDSEDDHFRIKRNTMLPVSSLMMCWTSPIMDDVMNIIKIFSKGCTKNLLASLYLNEFRLFLLNILQYFKYFFPKEI
jgi:hypothetical protein